MTNEELERAMNFIVEMEAKSSAKIGALSDSHKETQRQAAERSKEADERWKRADERWDRTEQSIRALLAIAELHEREITSLGETARATDDRLNALINVVERQMSNGSNGKQ